MIIRRPFHEAWLAREKTGQRKQVWSVAAGSAPLLDLALLWFVFFLVASPFVMQPGVLVELPTAPFSQGARYGSLVVTLSQEGLIFFNDERTSLDELETAFVQAAREHPGDTLIIEADGRVPHETLVRVYHQAMRAGIKDIALATQLAPAATEVIP